jgi:hypothetical protein
MALGVLVVVSVLLLTTNSIALGLLCLNTSTSAALYGSGIMLLFCVVLLLLPRLWLVFTVHTDKDTELTLFVIYHWHYY